MPPPCPSPACGGGDAVARPRHNRSAVPATTLSLGSTPMTQELSGRVAIVTGAGRNIGRAIALALADGGAAIVVNARSNLQEAEAVAREIEREGGKAFAVTADVADAGAGGCMVVAAACRFRGVVRPVRRCAWRRG